MKSSFEERFQNNPAKFELPNLPAIWHLNSFDIQDFPTDLGHSLSLGVMKSLCTFTFRYFLTYENGLEYFSSKLNDKLKSINESNCSFLHVQPSVGLELSFTGWLCRHWVSFARCSK